MQLRGGGRAQNTTGGAVVTDVGGATDFSVGLQMQSGLFIGELRGDSNDIFSGFGEVARWWQQLTAQDTAVELQVVQQRSYGGAAAGGAAAEVDATVLQVVAAATKMQWRCGWWQQQRRVTGELLLGSSSRD